MSKKLYLVMLIAFILCIVLNVVNTSRIDRICFPGAPCTGHGPSQPRRPSNSDKYGTRLIANVSQCADANQTYCTKDNNYPLDLMERILQENSNRFEEYFGSDSIPDEVITRMEFIDEIQLCDSQTELYCPEAATNKNGEDRFIFQARDKKQCIRINKCTKPDGVCNSIINVPNNYRSECRQEYVYHEFLIASPQGTVVKDKFKFPVCCSCSVIRT